MLKMLKIGCFKKITVSQVCLKVFPCIFLLNSGESQVNVTSFTYPQWFDVSFIISKISIAVKCSKCLK